MKGDARSLDYSSYGFRVSGLKVSGLEVGAWWDYRHGLQTHPLVC